MERVNRICNHPMWRESLTKIQELERKRKFCRHDLVHFLDVARIAQIRNLEKNLDIPAEWIYASALLHDIGRHLQYLEGTSHEKASAKLAEIILIDCGFELKEREIILHAILNHRVDNPKGKDQLVNILCWADKQSRACLFCPVEKECSWNVNKKNLILSV